MKKLFITTLLVFAGFVAQAQITPEFLAEHDITGKNIEIAHMTYILAKSKYPTYSKKTYNHLIDLADHYKQESLAAPTPEDRSKYAAMSTVHLKWADEPKNNKNGTKPITK